MRRLRTWFVLACARVRDRLGVNTDTVHLPGLHAPSAQPRLIGAASILLAEQHVHATLRPLCRPPGVAGGVM